MADIGHEQTDKLIRAMEKRINKIYRQATREMAAKCDDYFRRFDVKDKLKRDEMKAGLITPKEYAEWRKGQMIVGERWLKMRNQLAQDMHNTNVIARSIVDGYMPEVYAINHDYATYLVEAVSTHRIRCTTVKLLRISCVIIRDFCRCLEKSCQSE